MRMLTHERLDVYRLSVELLGEILLIIGSLPPGNHDVASQLRRAAMSIPLNIAEGAGKTGAQDKRRYYSIARGSALETGAIFDLLIAGRLKDREGLKRPRRYLERIAAMLGAMTTRV